MPTPARRRNPSANTAAGGFISVTLAVRREGKQYVSECLELGTASCGDTLDEAADNIKEATLEYLNTIERLGERERIFREKGIVLRKRRPSTIRREVNLHPNGFVGPLVTRVPVPA
jgi:predicted RNase H-like HicB family nuclease